MRHAVGILAAAAMTLASPAHAETVCAGQVVDLRMDKVGTVFVSFGFGNMKACSLSDPFTMSAPNNTVAIATATCEALYSSFLSAKVSDRNIALVIVEADCTGLVDSSARVTKTIRFYSFTQQ